MPQHLNAAGVTKLWVNKHTSEVFRDHSLTVTSFYKENPKV